MFNKLNLQKENYKKLFLCVVIAQQLLQSMYINRASIPFHNYHERYYI